MTESPDGITLRGKREDREISISAKFVIDASGPRGFLHRALGIQELKLPGFPSHSSALQSLLRCTSPGPTMEQ